MYNPHNHAFTLAELLITITIIALISTATASIYVSSVKRARDAQRLADMETIRTALEMYRIDNGNYPGYVGSVGYGETSDCAGWDSSYDGIFIPPLVDGGYLDRYYMDPLNDPDHTSDAPGSAYACAGHGSSGYNYFYYLYNADAGNWLNQNKCTKDYGDYYVLGIGDLETTGRPSPVSPGFQCPPSPPGRSWSPDTFEWAAGEYSGTLTPP